ncbi:PTS mannose/fructose/sorbose transporter subunit IIC [Levilactobacillus bambusae]|uniref:PTS mannose/fructose/sorbose transporter subunit IIC n=1 Tax=Levilactobacillus bambusae TaxID=2024736 RepID=A0A2V1MWH6_9LACO|nr:PTS mannose/fructose/sorbose transporter subunit IIC [Levilactobacillus bambusae]PWF99408.1 PTS mannose/fructose/sorbose transporter subunit IIC [Levilactobacillus bambusae]
MSGLAITGLIVVAFLAGVDVILDEWELAQPIVACTLVGLAVGDVQDGILLGAHLQLLALGWMNIGSAIPPDAALASVVSAILVCGPAQMSIHNGIAIAVPLAIAGQVLNIFVRTIIVFMAHLVDKKAENGDWRGLDRIHYFDMCLQGLRIAIPAYLVTIVSPQTVQNTLNAVPKVITNGLAIAGGFIVAVGFAMVVNMMASTDLWPFFFLGFALAAVKSLNLIAFGIIGLCMALIYIQLSPRFAVGDIDAAATPGSSTEDEIDRELEDL